MRLGCKVVNIHTGEVGWITAILNTGELLRISERFNGGGAEHLSASHYWEDSPDCCFPPEPITVFGFSHKTDWV